MSDKQVAKNPKPVDVPKIEVTSDCASGGSATPVGKIDRVIGAIKRSLSPGKRDKSPSPESRRDVPLVESTTSETHEAPPAKKGLKDKVLGLFHLPTRKETEEKYEKLPEEKGSKPPIRYPRRHADIGINIKVPSEYEVSNFASSMSSMPSEGSLLPYDETHVDSSVFRSEDEDQES